MDATLGMYINILIVKLVWGMGSCCTPEISEEEISYNESKREGAPLNGTSQCCNRKTANPKYYM